MKSPAKMAKTSGVLKMPSGIIPEVEGTCYESAKQVEVLPTQNKPSCKSPIVETSFTSDNIVNTTSSTPL